MSFGLAPRRRATSETVRGRTAYALWVGGRRQLAAAQPRGRKSGFRWRKNDAFASEFPGKCGGRVVDVGHAYGLNGIEMCSKLRHLLAKDCDSSLYRLANGVVRPLRRCLPKTAAFSSKALVLL